jgi:hypothetical protein
VLISLSGSLVSDVRKNGFGRWQAVALHFDAREQLTVSEA